MHPVLRFFWALMFGYGRVLRRVEIPCSSDILDFHRRAVAAILPAEVVDSFQVLLCDGGKFLLIKANNVVCDQFGSLEQEAFLPCFTLFLLLFCC